jgi:hypothetical protein
MAANRKHGWVKYRAPSLDRASLDHEGILQVVCPLRSPTATWAYSV